MAQAAAFVTPRDPAVDELARQAEPAGAAARGSTRSAIAIWRSRPRSTDALAELGVAYVPDPTNPFATISATPHAVDTIHYPYQTLDRLSGDCDDTTVLMASLLGNVGVNTRFVDVPGHIFLIVDTGLHERDRSALGVDSTLTVIADDEVWVPIETTSLAHGFAQAWRDGADEIAAASLRGPVTYVDVLGLADSLRAGAAAGRAPRAHAGREPLRHATGRRGRDRGSQLRDEYYLAHYGAVAHDLEASADASRAGGARGSRGRGSPGRARAARARTRTRAAVGRGAQQSRRGARRHGQPGSRGGSVAHRARAGACAARHRAQSAAHALGRGRQRRGAWTRSRAALAGAGGYEAACRLIGLAPGDSLGRRADVEAEDAGASSERVRNLLRRQRGAASRFTRHIVPTKPAIRANDRQLLPANRGIWKYLYWLE